MQKEELEKSLIIFTDGSSLGNPGPGGWGAILINPKIGEVIELGGSKIKTTNNEMELEAILSALTYSVHNSNIIHIFTDSKYAINGLTKWMYNWSQDGWKTQNGDEIKNLFQWKTLFQLVQDRGKDTINWHHISAHVGIPGNERVDDIARWSAEGQDVYLFRGNITDYEIKDILSFDFEKHEKTKHNTTKKKAYSYLSIIDGKLQKHETWMQCEARVKGKKAKYKKALSEKHEKEIIKEWENEK